MSAENILLVEDDPTIAEPLARALTREGYIVRITDSGKGAFEAVAHHRPAAILLDLGLPDIDGLEVCRTLRADGYVAPIVMLTARSDEVDVVVGLDAGADDYVAKPFRYSELSARIRALFRHWDRNTKPMQAEGLRLDVDARRAYIGRNDVHLTGKEFALLQVLYDAAGAVVSYEDIGQRVWGKSWREGSKTMTTHLSTLRRKLGDDAESQRYIVTVRGIGFRFNTDAAPAKS